MADAPPALNSDDLALELKEYLSTDRAHFHFAFFGTRAGATEVSVEGHGAYQIEPVRCELELRERFAALGEVERVAWLVPFQGHVPHDLRHRFAKDGSVRTVGALSRLRRLFAVQSVEPGLDNGPLAQWLMQRDVADWARLAVKTQRLTAGAMWSAWFAAETGITGFADLNLGQWMLRCAEHGGGPRLFALRKESALGERVLAAFVQHCERVLGALGALALQAWGGGRGTSLLHHAVVASALLESGKESALMWLELKLDSLGLKGTERLAELSDAGEQALQELARVEGGRTQLVALLRAAEDVVDKPVPLAALALHRWLPVGFRARLDELGMLLQRALATPSAENFQHAVVADAELAKHHHYAEFGKEDADRARMAVRLLGFLERARSWMRQLPAADLDAAQRLATWYSQEGGYVDLARYQLRTSQESEFGRGLRKVAAEVDEVRRALDRRFAQGLSQWLGAGASPGRVQPIQHALGYMLKSALTEQPERRALVLLMDGMGWAECIALLRSSAESADAFAPLSLNRELSKVVGDPEGSPHGLATLAAIPTITMVSRSAFFEGKLPSSGREPSSSDDERRFASHPVVTELNGHPARLLLRAEGHHADGELSSEARTLIGDLGERVVGLVVNAVDASLKGDSQHVHQWTVGAVRSLAAIFDEARRAGRIVLFASDHGHVRGTNIEKATRPDNAVVGGERWRGMAGDEQHGALGDQPGGPMTFACKSVWAPAGAHGVTVLTDERGRHSRQPHAGEHGGATLAEVVAPCLWIGSAAEAPERSPAVEGLFVPDWWLLKPADAAAVPAASKGAGSRPTWPGVDVAARAGKGGAPTRSRRPSQPVLSAFALALEQNELFKLRTHDPKLRNTVVMAVDFLRQREGLASLQDLGDAVGVPFYRVAGLISQLQRVLNVDGESVLIRPPESSQVVLKLDALTQLFEVEP